MAKLADAADLKSAGAKSPVGVRFPLPAPTTCAAQLIPDRIAVFHSMKQRVPASSPNGIDVRYEPQIGNKLSEILTCRCEG